MKVSVTVKPNAKQAKIVKTGDNQFSVWVTVPPKENKANEAVIEALAEYFNTAKSGVLLLRGGKGKNKVFEIYV